MADQVTEHPDLESVVAGRRWSPSSSRGPVAPSPDLERALFEDGGRRVARYKLPMALLFVEVVVRSAAG